jgi:hypothetical protein
MGPLALFFIDHLVFGMGDSGVLSMTGPIPLTADDFAKFTSESLKKAIAVH